MALHANKRIMLPDVNITEEEERRIFDQLFSSRRFFALDHEGSVEDDSLLDKIEYAATVDGCKIVFLDHITIAVSDCVAGQENISMDKFMNRLLKLVKRLNICVIVVSHLRKVGGGGKSFEEGRIPTEDDLKGSGSLKQIAMTTIAIARNKYAENEKERNTTSFHVLKCRFSGRTGPCDHAYFDDDTGRMNVIDPETFFEETSEFDDTPLGGTSSY
jgi:twinkle protein